MIAIQLGGITLAILAIVLLILNLDTIALIFKFIWTFLQMKVESARSILRGPREEYDDVSDIVD